MSADSQFVGQIMAVGFNFAPTGWAQCNGQLMSISQNTALFALLGTRYGGDGRTTFALPNLNNAVPIGYGQGDGLTYRSMGEQGGEEATTLITTEMPAHNHTMTGGFQGSGAEANSVNATGNVLASSNGTKPGSDIQVVAYNSATPTVNMAANSVSFQAAPAGGSLPHNNMQPSLVVNYIIALQGVFPPRN